ncbi:MAG TPA: type II toxin-antitoxin system VapC family toxin [Azospirillum sp.]
MKLLLDTHAFLFWTSDDPRLPPAAREAIADPSSLVFLSAASVWEIGIKRAKGRLRTSFSDTMEEAARHHFVELPMTAAHAAGAAELPSHHEDPFDRMLIAQARADGLVLVTGDSIIPRYGVRCLWNRG